MTPVMSVKESPTFVLAFCIIVSICVVRLASVASHSFSPLSHSSRRLYILTNCECVLVLYLNGVLRGEDCRQLSLELNPQVSSDIRPDITLEVVTPLIRPIHS